MPFSKASGEVHDTQKMPNKAKYGIGRTRQHKEHHDGGQWSPVDKEKYCIGERRKGKTCFHGYGDNGPIPGNGHPGAHEM